jgi:hypothetical protein
MVSNNKTLIKRKSASYHNVREAALVPGTIIVCPGPQLVHDGETYYDFGANNFQGYARVIEIGVFLDTEKLNKTASPMAVKELSQSQLTRRNYGADVKVVHYDVETGKADRKMTGTNFRSASHEWEFIPTTSAIDGNMDDQEGLEFVTRSFAYRVSDEVKEYALPTYKDGKIALDEDDNVILEFKKLPTLVPVNVPQEWYDAVADAIHTKGKSEHIDAEAIQALKRNAFEHGWYTEEEEKKYGFKVEAKEVEVVATPAAESAAPATPSEEPAKPKAQRGKRTTKAKAAKA